MKTILTIIQSPTDQSWFDGLFKKAGIRHVTARPILSSYTKMLQFEPSVVIIEVSASPVFFLRFLESINCNKQIQKIRFILYGPRIADDVLAEFRLLGVGAYLTLPLDIKKVITAIMGKEDPKKFNQPPSPTQKIAGYQAINQLSDDEIERLRDKDVPVDEKLILMMAHVGKLMMFPATVANILRVTSDANTGAADLAKVIKSDPAVSTEVIKVANSVFFGSINKRIIDFKDAIIRIGFTQTKSIAMSMSVFKVMKDRNYETGFSHIEYWFHCLGVAAIAESIARRTGLVNSEEAFIAGLLHDIGILLYNEYFNELFLMILDKATDDGVPFLTCQKEMLGFTHNDLVVKLFESWNFPADLLRFITNLYNPRVLDDGYVMENPLAVLVNVSEVIAKSLQIGREADCCVHPVPNLVLEKFALPYGVQEQFVTSVYDEMNKFNSFLRIDPRSYPMPHQVIHDASRVRLLALSFTDEKFSPVSQYLRSQQYSVTASNGRNIAENECAKNHAVVICDAADESVDAIRRLSEGRVLAYMTDGAHAGDDVAETLPARMILFSQQGGMITEQFSKTSLVSSYPVDLRNIDLVLANLLLDHPMESVNNEIGSLRRVAGFTLDGRKMDTLRVVLAHSDKLIAGRLIGYCKSLNMHGIETAVDGPAAYALAKANRHEIDLFIIELNIPGITCSELIVKLRNLPGHKRAEYMVVIRSATREELLSIITAGVKDFIPEAVVIEEFETRLKKMGVLS